METPIDQIIGSADASAKFEEMPRDQNNGHEGLENLEIPVTSQIPLANAPGFIRETFTNIQNIDIISVIVVFLILLAITMGYAYIPVKTFPSLYDNSRMQPTNIGAMLVAIIGALIYMLVIFIGKVIKG